MTTAMTGTEEQRHLSHSHNNMGPSIDRKVCHRVFQSIYIPMKPAKGSSPPQLHLKHGTSDMLLEIDHVIWSKARTYAIGRATGRSSSGHGGGVMSAFR